MEDISGLPSYIVLFAAPGAISRKSYWNVWPEALSYTLEKIVRASIRANTNVSKVKRREETHSAMPPPPMPLAKDWRTLRQTETVTEASTAFPPCFRMSAPILEQLALSLATAADSYTYVGEMR